MDKPPPPPHSPLPGGPADAGWRSVGRGGWLSLLVLVAVFWSAAEALSWWRQQSVATELREHTRPGDIVMYTTSDCPYCAAARRWLDARRIPWRDCNVEHEPACMQTYQSVGAPGVPLFNVRGQWHLGFDPRSLAQTLAQSPGAPPTRGAQPR